MLSHSAYDRRHSKLDTRALDTARHRRNPEIKKIRDKQGLSSRGHLISLSAVSLTALIVSGLFASDVHAKADMCGVDNGMPGAGCTVDSFCDLDPPSQVPGPVSGGGCGLSGFTHLSSSCFDAIIDGDSRTVQPCDENFSLTGTSGWGFKMGNLVGSACSMPHGATCELGAIATGASRIDTVIATSDRDGQI